MRAQEAGLDIFGRIRNGYQQQDPHHAKRGGNARYGSLIENMPQFFAPLVLRSLTAKSRIAVSPM